ncbi:hypothetical protein [Parasitella parasitica]|uniref:DUF3020 domain-containing protein n=1 Tax=Parasitella parasitica TaxID=35722 RepID=A0A0B7N1N0_9FUNG|nr:hypothetical protein [Parasitella parasitica]
MENPNIHNIPYARSRDQKRWSGHTKKVSSRADTTERMRKWRAENRDKNKRNDLRCRVYRLARQKFGEDESEEKHQFITQEINRRLGRRMLLEQKNKENASSTDTACHIEVKEEFISDNSYSRSPSTSSPQQETLNELPFYCAPLHKIELPSINMDNRRPSQSTEPSGYISKSQPPSPMSDNVKHNDDRRLSGCSMHSSASNISLDTNSINTSTNTPKANSSSNHDRILPTKLCDTLPPMLAFLPPVSRGSKSQLPSQ